MDFVKPFIRVVGLVLMVMLVAAWCSGGGEDRASDDSKESLSPPSASPTGSPSAPVTSTSPSATPTAAPTSQRPEAAWDALLAAGADDDLLEPDEVQGLPQRYWPEPGSDEYTDEVFDRVLRRDIAAYLLRVRQRAPRVADELSSQLGLVPVGWCSVVGPRLTWDEFQNDAREDASSAVLLADLLDVPYEPLLSPAQARLTHYAVREAAKWFCPEQSLGLREPVEDADVEDAAAFPERDHYSIQEMQRQGYALWTSGFDADGRSRFEMEMAFQSALVGIHEVYTEFGCDMAAYFSRGDSGVRKTAENIVELNPSVDDRLWDVWEHQTLNYQVEQEHRACGDGRL